MPDYFEHRVTRGAVKLSRGWTWADDQLRPTRGGGGCNAGEAGPSTAGRLQTTFSPRSRRALRYICAGLPWEKLGERPALVTLTYPADWRAVCPDARAMVAHRKALKERWRRRYATPTGLWVVEFQPRLRRPVAEQFAPHIHMYVGLPDAVTDAEYHGLVVRRLNRQRLERAHGKYDGRARVEPPTGEFAEWLLNAWYEVVGSGLPRHRRRGVDITPAFWSSEAAASANRTQIGDYFWRESGKMGQKSPPEGFGGLAFYGVWGQRQGFIPAEGVRDVDRDVFVELRRLYRRVVQKRMAAAAVAAGKKPRKYKGPRGMDGLTAFVPDAMALGTRAQEWAMGHVLSKPLPV
jgi:hypothetical protein